MRSQNSRPPKFSAISSTTLGAQMSSASFGESSSKATRRRGVKTLRSLTNRQLDELQRRIELRVLKQTMDASLLRQHGHKAYKLSQERLRRMGVL